MPLLEGHKATDVSICVCVFLPERQTHYPREKNAAIGIHSFYLQPAVCLVLSYSRDATHIC